MVKIIDGSIIKDIEFYERMVQQQQNQKKPSLLKASLSDSFSFFNHWMTHLVDTLELSTKILNCNLKLKYLISICIFSRMIFGSIGLLTCLLIMYLGTLYNSKSNNNCSQCNSLNCDNHDINNLSTPQSSSSPNTAILSPKLTSSSQSLSNSANRIQTLSSSTPSVLNTYSSSPCSSSSFSSLSSSAPNSSFIENNIQEEEEEEQQDLTSKPAFHLYSSPNLRSSSKNINNDLNLFSPNLGRKLGSN
ncbi:hypothetical protein CYY_009620 [Polysphondylium violaceum]|uniref:Uncharacterized protein n=1 Tax=Polysphondylium violaceum TaxID=133409 RepID=A0A8J4PTC4_9MYCE|nr:hypothetical protein CYY_009620 [Polysphondylium violaceum]